MSARRVFLVLAGLPVVALAMLTVCVVATGMLIAAILLAPFQLAKVRR